MAKVQSTPNHHVIQEILHRLELKEGVSLEELVYLHKQAVKYPEIERWISKLLEKEEMPSREKAYDFIDLTRSAA